MDSILRTNYLRIVPKLILFLTSYSPLFVCIIVRQLYYNRSFLHFAGFDMSGIMCLLHKFGLSILLGLVLVLVTLGTILFLKILRSNSKNGNNVTVKSISNKKCRVYRLYSNLYNTISLSEFWRVRRHHTIIDALDYHLQNICNFKSAFSKPSLKLQILFVWDGIRRTGTTKARSHDFSI